MTMTADQVWGIIRTVLAAAAGWARNNHPLAALGRVVAGELEPGAAPGILVRVDDRGIQLILREVQSESLIVALKGASEELREKIFKNMSQRASEMMREDLEAKGPVRISEVEAEQKEILKVIRRLVEEGQISLNKGGEEAYV